MTNLTAPQTSVKSWTVCQGDALLHLRRMQGAGYAAIMSDRRRGAQILI